MKMEFRAGSNVENDATAPDPYAPGLAKLRAAADAKPQTEAERFAQFERRWKNMRRRQLGLPAEVQR